MIRPGECGVRPTHPRIKCMEMTRTLSGGETLYGCVCGMIYTDGSGSALAVAGHGSAVYKLTAICWQPEVIMPYDRLKLDSAEYTVVSVSESGGGILSAVLRPESIRNG